MTESPHIEPERIADLLESGAEIPIAIRDHMQSCAECAGRVRDFERLLSLLELARIPEPDEALVRSTWERIRAEEASVASPRSAVSRLREGLREIWATIATDALVPSMAVRGSEVASPRLLVYETPDYAISLSIAHGKRKGSLEVHGRLIPRGQEALPAGGTARLSAGDATREEGLGEFGSFFFEEVSALPFHLEIEIGEQVLRLPAIEEGD